MTNKTLNSVSMFYLIMIIICLGQFYSKFIFLPLLFVFFSSDDNGEGNPKQLQALLLEEPELSQLARQVTS